MFVAHYRQSDETHQSLITHLKETSVIACCFAGKIGLPNCGELIGLLHDFGKYSDAFQTYLQSAVGILDPDNDEYVDATGMKGKIDHSSAGAQFAWNAFRNENYIRQFTGQVMALCLASHHSGLIDCLSPDGSDKFGGRMAKSEEKTHLFESKGKADDEIIKQATSLLSSPNIENELQSRLKYLFDGEPSQEIREFRIGLLVRFLFSALIDADRLSSANFDNPDAASERYNGAYPEWSLLVGRLESHLTGLQERNRVDGIRNEISASCLNFARREKGLFQLTVPTGGGKTLASLRFALQHAEHHKMDRIFYIVPYTTIIDQNAATIRGILETGESKGRIVLEHHSSLTPEKATWQNKALSENWDAPIVFTTMVQFLDTLFASGTRGARRMHQLANAVIIFDEIQALPIKTVHLFNNAVNFIVGQCRSTAVFCTATQSLLDKVQSDKGAAMLSPDSEIMPDKVGLFRDLRRVEVADMRKAGGWSEDEVAEAALQEESSSGSVLVIVNTKSQAKEIYKRCTGKTENVFHLSTSMCPAHRMEILSKVKKYLNPKNPRPIICISTQLIEAGVDVDFGSVIRYLAGLDSIAQAAGRCNRNGVRPTGRVIIVNPSNENLDRLPDIRIAKEKAERVLDEFSKDHAAFGNDLLSPAAMERYYRYYFYERAHEMAYPISAKEIGRHDNLLSLLSTNSLSVASYRRQNNSEAPKIILRQSFMSAGKAFKVIDAPTEGVIVPYGEGAGVISDLLGEADPAGRKALLRKAQMYSVNLFRYELETITKNGGIFEAWEGSGIMCLEKSHYSKFGVSVERSELMEDYQF